MARPKAAAAAAAAASLPFQLFTRQIPEFLQNAPIALGGARQTVELDNVGYADALLLNVKGTVTVATAPLVLNPGMPWDVLPNITVQPPGLIPPVNLSGKMLHYLNLLSKDFSPFTEGADFPGQALDVNAFDAANIDVFPVAIGVNNVNLWFVVPFHRSSMDVRGILPLGSKQRVNLSFSVCAAADLCTVPANVTGNALSVDIYQLYYPAPPQGIGADPDPYWAVTYEELSQPIAALGDQVINIEPGATILAIAHLVVMNSSQDSADITKLTLRVNKSYYLNQLPAAAWWFIQRRRLGFPLPAGVVAYDFDHFADDGSLDVREWVHSSDVQTVQSTISIPAGTLGTNPRVVTAVRRLVDLHGTA